MYCQQFHASYIFAAFFHITYLYCIYLFLYTHIPHLSHTSHMKKYLQLDKNIWGAYAYV